MEQKEKRLLILRALGWRFKGDPDFDRATKGWFMPETFAASPEVDLSRIFYGANMLSSKNSAPDPFTDLNYAREALLKLLGDNKAAWLGYWDNLEDITKATKADGWGRPYTDEKLFLTASAEQISEALGLTLGLWKEETAFDKFKKEFDEKLAKMSDEELAELFHSEPEIPKPNTWWAVIYEQRKSIVHVSPDGKGFFAVGQDALWPLSEAEWVEQVADEEGNLLF